MLETHAVGAVIGYVLLVLLMFGVLKIRFPKGFSFWLERWKKRLALDAQTSIQRQVRIYALNPVFIPRNHLIEEVIQATVREGDFNLFHQLVAILAHPFEYKAALKKYALAPRPEQVVNETFCGT